MQTRRGICYQWPDSSVALPFAGTARKRGCGGGTAGTRRKRWRTADWRTDFFDCLPDDLVLFILTKLSATAGAPADLISVLLTCRRFCRLGVNPTVLSNISANGTAMKAKNWSESAHRFLNRCAEAGSVEASYTLGMIEFYCLENRGAGASLMAKAAVGSHAAALYSLGVIQFNGSGGSKVDKDLRAGVALCARAAYHGHIDALRELGHCLQDGYGVRQNVAVGRRFLIQANARELSSVISPPSSARRWKTHREVLRRAAVFPASSLLSDFGCNVPAAEAHPANRFLVEWFAARGGPSGFSGDSEGGEARDELRMCSHVGCGRPETRRHEFRRCSVCGAVNYCSRACQALHWKLAHKVDCAPMDRWLDDGPRRPLPAANGGGQAN
ncbi:F-box protein [Apostasia shenzhenica]|uniref:F-box protein n=1 Tax=Apostasia shenzhenica TaxID=1088818 RepID=A0A2I0B0P7_9ASPA|nr:F-box protein [Apostasia shenzhenica]